MSRSHPRGMTLMELLVASFMGVLASVAVVALFKTGLNAQFSVLYPNTAGRAARLAMDTLTDHLRSAQAITAASASSVTYTDSSGNSVRYWLSGGNLVSSTNGSPSSGTIVVEGVSALTLGYWYWNGSAWTSGIPSTLNTIGAVDVSLSATATGYTASLTSTVRLRNIIF